MQDGSFLRTIASPLDLAAARFARLGVGPVALEAVGFAFGLAASVCIAAQRPLAGLALLVLNRLTGAIAGAMASGNRDLARTLGAVFEPAVRMLVPFAFAIADSSRALAAAFVILSIALAALASRARTDDGHDSLRAMEVAVVYAALAIACVVPDWFSVMAYALGIASFVLTGVRVAAAVERQT